MKNVRARPAPRPLATSSVAGSIDRSPGITMRWAIGARKIDNASHAPANPYGVGISTPNHVVNTPEGPVAPMIPRAAM